jgi:hypothetical protein
MDCFQLWKQQKHGQDRWQYPLSLNLSIRPPIIVGKWKPVPPTPYYLSKRAEMFSASASKALAEGRVTDHSALVLKAIEYRNLAGQLPLEKDDNDNNLQGT